MKRNGILNSRIASVLGNMGHTDTICVSDCGLPTPQGVERIDLSLRLGVPSLADVLHEIAKDMVVERITIAAEIREHNPQILKQVGEAFPSVEIRFIPHAQFKSMTEECRAVIRTGEATSYANVILHSGVIF
jgi:D-ribose pyranase